jgi:hypothetical protein
MLQNATGMAVTLDEMYQFIPGEDNDERYRPTTRDQLARARALKETLLEAKAIIIEELAAVENRVSNPARDMRTHLEIYRKNKIKFRENKKVSHPCHC